jgi:hypothetical protein
MYTKVRVLCWIMTTPKNHWKKARHDKNTWGKRCNRLIFISTETGDLFHLIRDKQLKFIDERIKTTGCLLSKSLRLRVMILYGVRQEKPFVTSINIIFTKPNGFSKLTTIRKKFSSSSIF